jgi:hypothetical protein
MGYAVLFHWIKQIITTHTSRKSALQVQLQIPHQLSKLAPKVIIQDVHHPHLALPGCPPKA